MPENAEYTDLLPAIIELSLVAGEAILAVYETDFSHSEKADSSPLTQADLASHQVIVDGLSKLSDLPVLSEESPELVDWAERRHWQQYWLVDPLDGTREFVNRTGEFTVNIALIEQGVATMGVVFCPTLNLLYYAAKGLGAFRVEGENPPISIKVAPPPIACSGSEAADYSSWKVVGSRRNGTDLLADFAGQMGSVELVNMGSSLKLCLVAEGKAHLYPRLAPTCEWDTAAAQAIVEQAGGMVLTPELQPLRYGEKEDLLNPFFIVAGAMDSRWADSFRQSAISIANSR